MTVQVAMANDSWTYLGHDVHCLSSVPNDQAADPKIKNGPALLLVHGFGASTDHWRYNIPVLAKTHEVHAIDLIGFGNSSQPVSRLYGEKESETNFYYNFENWAEQIADFYWQGLNQENRISLFVRELSQTGEDQLKIINRNQIKSEDEQPL